MITKLSDRTRGGLALFGASAIYATFGPLIRVLSEMFGDYSQVAARMGLAFIFLLVISLLFNKIKKLTRPQTISAALLGVTSTGILIFFTIGVTQVKIATAVFLLYAASMISSLIFGTVFFKETLGAQKIIALALAFVGLFLFGDVLIALSSGIIACLLSGICEGIGNGIRKSLKGADRTTVLLYQFFVNATLASILMIFAAEPIIKTVSTAPIIAVVAFAILQLILNHLLLFGFQSFDVNIGTVILSLELFFAAILGFIFFGEALTTAELLGGLAIFIASIVSAWEFKKTPAS